MSGPISLLDSAEYFRTHEAQYAAAILAWIAFVLVIGAVVLFWVVLRVPERRRRLAVRYPKLTALLGRFARLRRIRPHYGLRITDSGILQLGSLKTLRHLSMLDVPITEASLAVLDDLPQIEELQVSVPISAEGMRHLRDTKSLTWLELTGCQITDELMYDLEKLRMLETLALGKCPVTDRSAKIFASFARLEALNLFKTKMTDGSVPELSKLTTLNGLGVGPGITREGALQIAKALPKCQVSYIDTSSGLEHLPLGGK